MRLVADRAAATTLRGAARCAAMRHNKGMKQTKPGETLELRSLSPVFAGPRVSEASNG